MTLYAMRDRYYRLLSSHFLQPDDQNLSDARELGRDLVSNGIALESVVEMHNAAIHLLARRKPDSQVSESAVALSALLVEVLRSYDAAIQQEADERVRVQGLQQQVSSENLVMAEIGRIISSAPEIEEVYQGFAEQVRRLVPFDRISITLVDFASERTMEGYTMGLDIPERQIGASIPLEMSATGLAIAARHGVLFDLTDVRRIAAEVPGLLPHTRVGIKTVMSVPLISRDRPVGALHIGSTQEGAYSQDEVALAEKVAAQIAGAVSNALLHSNLQREVREREVLAKIGRIVSSSLDVDQVYEGFADAARELIPFDRISISLVDVERGTCSIAYVAGTEVPGYGKGDESPLAGSLNEHVFNMRAGVIVQTNSEEEVARRFPALVLPSGTGLPSVLAAPLISHDRVIGVMQLRSKKRNAFDALQLQLAEQIGLQIAGAIANAQLFAAQKQTEEELRRAHGELERRVRERTAELSAANEALQAEVEEHKRTETALRESEAKFHSLVENAADAFILIDERARVVDVNQRACDSLGYTREELLRLGLRDISVNFDCKVFSERWEKLSPGMPLTVSAAHRRKDGSKFPVEIHASVVVLGGQQYIAALARDVTERRRAEEALRASEEEARTLAHENAVLAEIGRIAGASLDSNDIYERLAAETRKLIAFDRLAIALVDFEADSLYFVYSQGLPVGTWASGERKPLTGSAFELALRPGRSHVLSFGPGVDVEAVLSRFPTERVALEGGLKTRLMVPLISNDKVIGGISLRSTRPDAYSHKEIALMERIAAQIAPAIENARLYEELRAAKEAAEAASNAKSEFLANVSHEIRTPLNGVLGMAQLLEATRLSQKQKRYVEMLKTSGDSLLGVINDVLDLSKIEAGRLELERVQFSLRETIGSVVDILGIRAQEKGLDLVQRVNDEVPDTLMGDPLRLRQVIINLVGNAIKFTERGHVEISVSIESQSAGGVACHFTVIDTGIGIPKEAQERVFEAFAQADTSITRRYGGTGLGLTISASLVRMMGGRIWVESEVGKGSAFHFTASFGVQPGVRETHKRTGHAKTKRGVARRRIRPLRILLVEDNRINQALILSLLASHRHTVTVAGDGQEALRLMDTEAFDLVLMDVQMPIMDGREATRQVREREKSSGKHIPIIAMTAHVMKGDREMCLAAGMDGYISKPIREQELLEVIGEVMDSRRKKDERGMSFDVESTQYSDWQAALDALAGNEALLGKMASMFIQDCSRYLTNIKQALETGNADTLTHTSHSLKGAVGIFAARRAFDLALEVEQAGRASDIAKAASLYSALEQEVHGLRDELGARLKQQASAGG